MQIRLFDCTEIGVAWQRRNWLGLAPMKHQLDFEKPIVELQNKLEELKKHPEKPTPSTSASRRRSA